MDILVTGAKGMLGTAVVSLLAQQGSAHHIVAPGRNELDLRDWSAVDRFFGNAHFDAVVHCAATLGGIQEHSNNKVRFLVDNARIGMNVVQASQIHRVTRLVNIGTAAWYGQGASQPSVESSIAQGLTKPDNEAYAWAKYLCLKLCQFAGESGLAYRTIVPCNLYGPGDKFSSATGHIIPAAINKIAHAKRTAAESVEIWGDGSALREFLYVGDLAELIVWCLSRLDDLPEYFNAGTGQAHSILHVYQTIAEVMNFRGQFTFDLSRPTGSKIRMMSSELIGQKGWRATTSLRHGLEKSVEFFEEQCNE